MPNLTTTAILEDALIQLVNNAGLLVILASRADWRWNRFELNRRTQSISLPSFRSEDVKQINPRYGALADPVFKLTKGYPTAVVQAYQWAVDRFEATDPKLVDKFKSSEADLILELVSLVFDKQILASITDSDLHTKINRLVRIVSPLRRFDDFILYKLLPTLEPELFGQVDTLETRGYIRQMSTKTYLVRWDPTKQAYAIDKAMRSLLAQAMKHQEFDRLGTIHHMMADWYQQMTDDDPSALHNVTYFLEHLYHWAQWEHLRNPYSDIETPIQRKIEESFSKYQATQRTQFLEEFKRDDDLAELLSDGYLRLKEFVEQLIEGKG